MELLEWRPLDLLRGIILIIKWFEIWPMACLRLELLQFYGVGLGRSCVYLQLLLDRCLYLIKV